MDVCIYVLLYIYIRYINIHCIYTTYIVVSVYIRYIQASTMYIYLLLYRPKCTVLVLLLN